MSGFRAFVLKKFFAFLALVFSNFLLRCFPLWHIMPLQTSLPSQYLNGIYHSGRLSSPSYSPMVDTHRADFSPLPPVGSTWKVGMAVAYKWKVVNPYDWARYR